MVELILPLESILSDKTKAKLVELFGNQINSLNVNQVKVLAMALSMDNISNSILQHSIELHRSDITSLLRSLCRDGYLISQGFGWGTNYILNKKLRHISCSDKNLNVNLISNQKDFIPDTESGELFDNYVNSDNMAKAESYGESYGGAQVVSKTRKRLSYDELSSKVVALCDTWMSCGAIARQLCYNSNYLSARIIPRMLSDGYIEPLHKDSAQHPGQKYRAVNRRKK